LQAKIRGTPIVVWKELTRATEKDRTKKEKKRQSKGILRRSKKYRQGSGRKEGKK